MYNTIHTVKPMSYTILLGNGSCAVNSRLRYESKRDPSAIE